MFYFVECVDDLGADSTLENAYSMYGPVSVIYEEEDTTSRTNTVDCSLTSCPYCTDDHCLKCNSD